jgi:hypothetical protein
MVSTTLNSQEDLPTAPSYPSITHSPDMAQTSTSNEPTTTTTQSPPPTPPSQPIGGGIITRSKNNIVKPVKKLNLHLQLSAPIEPNTITQALRDPDWRSAM